MLEHLEKSIQFDLHTLDFVWYINLPFDVMGARYCMFDVQVVTLKKSNF